MPDLDLPQTSAERDRWVLARRGPRNRVDPSRAYAAILEHECADDGTCLPTATLFLTNRECPWRCVMCDLWKNTLETTVPVGSIPSQIEAALRELGPEAAASPNRQIKLYNSGSFFDPGAIPIADHPVIAEQVAGYRRVVVECHPALVGDRVVRFQSSLASAADRAQQPPPELEVAIGLETVNPGALERLNKRMTVEDFRRAAAFLREHRVSLRVFLLVQPPFLDEELGAEWLRRSMVEAFDAGATVVSLIPTRLGSGALDHLAQAGQFCEPRLEALESALDYGLGLRRGRAFADLWDLERFSRCPECFPARRERLAAMNHRQTLLGRIVCDHCNTHG